MKYPNIEHFNPSTCLSGKINQINRLTAQIFRKYLNEFNVTDSQVSILFVLSKKGSSTQAQLCAILNLEKSSLHRNLKRLVTNELITKASFPNFELTTQGKKLVETIIPSWELAMKEIRNLIGRDGEVAVHALHKNLTTKI